MLLQSKGVGHTSNYFIYLFFFKRERIWASGGAGETQRVRGRENSSRLPAECRIWCRDPSHDPEIMTGAEIKSQTLKRLSHPGTPHLQFLNCDPQILKIYKESCSKEKGLGPYDIGSSHPPNKVRIAQLLSNLHTTFLFVTSIGSCEKKKKVWTLQ